MKCFLSLLVTSFLFLNSVNAEYLIVQRNGNLRKEASTESEILEKIKVTDTLLLIETSQTPNGYYHVISYLSGQEGFVYRNLVRKVEGEIENPFAPTNVDAVVDIRVLDVGPGLATLIKLPQNKFVIYDAGGDYNTDGNRTLEQIKEYIPAGSDIELMILSHTDADHLVAAGQVIRDYKVKKVLWTGYEKSMISAENQTEAYKRFINFLNGSTAQKVNLNALDSVITPGTKFNIGNVTFTFLCGFGKPLPEWNLSNQGEKLNSVSIIMKLTFAGRSVLFCGDAVGRHLTDDEDGLIATEQYLIDNASAFLPSEIIVAPHHGANNGSSKAFVEAVKPEYVIFSAGHRYSHPTGRTANQYLRFTDVSKIFRTDRGDDEKTATEWFGSRIQDCTDKYNDDNVQIQLRSNGTYRVYYLIGGNVCN
jgi:beta-lactamase superfamily II metal-dependent hydrolase